MMTTITKANHSSQLRIFGVLLLAVVVLLQGCAAVLAVEGVVLVAGGAAIIADPSIESLPKSETNSVTLPYPIAKVYSTLNQAVERNGRKIVETTPAAYALRVSYPFSFLANNWGGVITITCAPDGNDTTIRVIGSGRDTNQRIQRIGDEIINDVKVALKHDSGTP